MAHSESDRSLHTPTRVTEESRVDSTQTQMRKKRRCARWRSQLIGEDTKQGPSRVSRRTSAALCSSTASASEGRWREAGSWKDQKDACPSPWGLTWLASSVPQRQRWLSTLSLFWKLFSKALTGIWSEILYVFVCLNLNMEANWWSQCQRQKVFRMTGQTAIVEPV